MPLAALASKLTESGWSESYVTSTLTFEVVFFGENKPNSGNYHDTIDAQEAKRHALKLQYRTTRRTECFHDVSGNVAVDIFRVNESVCIEWLYLVWLQAVCVGG